jgi:hypothetical protein
MSISSIGGGYSTASLYTSRLASGVKVKSSNASSTKGSSSSDGSSTSADLASILQSLAQQGGAQGAGGLPFGSGGPPGGAGFPGGGKGPDLPDSLKSKLDSTIQGSLKSGSSPDDVKKSLDTAVNDYLKSDDYKNLSSSDRKNVDDFVANKDKAAQNGQGGFNPFSQLEQLGSNTRNSVLSKFGLGYSSSSTSTNSDLQQTLLSLLSSSSAKAA